MEKISIQKLIATEFQVSEAVKTLRTNLFFSGADKRIIGLTSYQASEGKSTLAVQLGASIAETGKRVVLVDADLRKSVLAGRLRMRGKILGLSHYLSGMVNADEMLYETDVKGFYMIFSGARVPNPAELLGNSGFSKLLSALRDTFDYVIVDTAPLGQVVDAAVIAPHLDGMLMVIDSTNNSYKQEKRVKAQLEKSGGRILGVVLNRVDKKDLADYYGKSRYSDD